MDELLITPTPYNMCAICGHMIPVNGSHDCPGTIEDRLTRIEDMLKQLVASK